MKRAEDTSGQAQRYIGLDVHKHYITAGGMNAQQEMVLRSRSVEMDRFKRWAEENLRSTDEVVLESSTNTWDVYDTVAPLVKRVVVAPPAEVKQIAKARVKTDNQDVVRLLRLLIADMLPEVWVPPVEVRELRALISYRWRLVKMATAIQNRMHSLFHRHNIQAPEGKIDTGENREWWENVQLSSLERLGLDQELKMLRLVRDHIVEVEAELGRLSTSERWSKQATHIMQLPGVGIVVTTPALHQTQCGASVTILSAIGETPAPTAGAVSSDFQVQRSWWAMPGSARALRTVGKNIATKGLQSLGARSCVGRWWKPPGKPFAQIQNCAQNMTSCVNAKIPTRRLSRLHGSG
jgi:hypothetical protein